MKKEERIYRHSEVSEKALERRLVEKVKEKGCMAIKMCDVNNCGLPDRLVVMPTGVVMWVEMKSAGNKPTALQESRIKELRRMGFRVFVLDSNEGIDEFVKLLEICLL